MSSSKARKITVSLPADVVTDIDFLAHVFGMSRSAFLSGLLVSTLPTLRDSITNLSVIMADKDSLSDAEALSRYRASSKASIDSLFNQILTTNEQGDLFDAN